MSELKEEVKNLRIEVDRLGKHLLGMIKDLKEEIDVDRVRRLENDSRAAPAHSTRPAVVDSKQQIVHLSLLPWTVLPTSLTPLRTWTSPTSWPPWWMSVEG